MWTSRNFFWNWKLDRNSFTFRPLLSIHFKLSLINSPNLESAQIPNPPQLPVEHNFLSLNRQNDSFFSRSVWLRGLRGWLSLLREKIHIFSPFSFYRSDLLPISRHCPFATAVSYSLSKLLIISVIKRLTCQVSKDLNFLFEFLFISIPIDLKLANYLSFILASNKKITPRIEHYLPILPISYLSVLIDHCVFFILI